MIGTGFTLVKVTAPPASRTRFAAVTIDGPRLRCGPGRHQGGVVGAATGRDIRGEG